MLANMICHYIFPEKTDVEKEQYVKFPIAHIRISKNGLVDCL